MTIYKYMERYYGIKLDYRKKYSHKNLKKMFSFLNEYNYDLEYSDRENEEVEEVEVIYVVDSYNRWISYLTPAMPLHGREVIVEIPVEKRKIADKEILEDLSNLPTYVLGELLSKYKKKKSFYKIIRRELVQRGRYENKVYKLNKKLGKIKDIDNIEISTNEKYQRKRKYSNI